MNCYHARVLKSALLFIAFTCVAHAADTPPATTFVPLAHSALVVLEVQPQAAGLNVRATRANGAPALSAPGLTLSLDGHPLAVTANPDGTWSARWPPGGVAGDRHVDAVLAHDGIRELLSGTLPVASVPAGPSGGLLGSHKQMIWWVLNLAIVLIAVLAVSRRMS